MCVGGGNNTASGGTGNTASGGGDASVSGGLAINESATLRWAAGSTDGTGTPTFHTP